MSSPTETGAARRTAEEVALPGGDFRLFVQKLAYQALIALGVLENPLTRTRAVHMGHAQGLIDDLRMLREMTRGNLTADQEEHLDQVVGELQQHFVRLKQEARG